MMGGVEVNDDEADIGEEGCMQSVKFLIAPSIL